MAAIAALGCHAPATMQSRHGITIAVLSLLLPPLQLPLDGLANELRPLVRPDNGVDTLQGILRKPDDGCFYLHWRAAHENNLPKSDIGY